MVNGWEMSKWIKTICKSHVKIFSGATAACIEENMRRFLQMHVDHLILHVRTDNLASSTSST